MTTNPPHRSTKNTWLFALFAATHAGIAYARGLHLFGSSMATVYAVVSLLTTGLLGYALLNRSESGSQAVSRSVFLIFVSIVLAVPTVFNPQVQHFIDLQATDRRIRSELHAVIQSEPVFASVTITTKKSKCVCVEISGSVLSQDDYDRLRSQVSSQCPTVSDVLIDWDLSILQQPSMN